MANSAAMRRTHIWQRRYQSRSDDWLCIGACAGTPGERVEMAVEEVGGLVANPLVPGSSMKRLLRGGIIHQGGSFLSLPACPSLSLSLSVCLYLTCFYYYVLRPCLSYLFYVYDCLCCTLSGAQFHFFHHISIAFFSFLDSLDLQ